MHVFPAEVDMKQFKWNVNEITLIELKGTCIDHGPNPSQCITIIYLTTIGKSLSYYSPLHSHFHDIDTLSAYLP